MFKQGTKTIILTFQFFIFGGAVALAKPNAPTSNWSEEKISSGVLNGLYINAGEKSPVILIVPGSGPTDLNGNSPLGVSANTYKLLAVGLAEKGFSSIRVDKRGLYSSSGAGDPNKVTVDSYAQDYRDWATTITQKTGQICIYFLGHSEGAMMASAAAINNSNICGLILVAGTGRPLGDVMREQFKSNPANRPILKQAFAAISRLEAGLKIDPDELNPALRPLFRSSVQDFLISSMKADPSQLAKQANKPTLILQGNRDIQVSVRDAKLLEEATNGHLVVINKMNHILKDAPKGRRKNIKTYSMPELPLSPGIVDAIAVFISAIENTRARQENSVQ